MYAWCNTYALNTLPAHFWCTWLQGIGAGVDMT